MTKVEDMKPGRELDIRVAKALGYGIYHYDKDYEENCYYMLVDNKGEFSYVACKSEEEAWLDCPAFSQTWRGAGDVAEMMAEKWPDFTIAHDEKGWTVVWGFDGHGWNDVTAETGPHALALSALMALEGTEDD